MDKRLVYISHPYGGKKENILSIEQIMRELISKNPSQVYISPVHLYGWLYDEMYYVEGLQLCIDLLSRADKMLVYGDCDKSQGCLAEIAYCRANAIPYEIVSGPRAGEAFMDNGDTMLLITHCGNIFEIEKSPEQAGASI